MRASNQTEWCSDKLLPPHVLGRRPIVAPPPVRFSYTFRPASQPEEEYRLWGLFTDSWKDRCSVEHCTASVWCHKKHKIVNCFSRHRAQHTLRKYNDSRAFWDRLTVNNPCWIIKPVSYVAGTRQETNSRIEKKKQKDNKIDEVTRA